MAANNPLKVVLKIAKPPEIKNDSPENNTTQNNPSGNIIRMKLPPALENHLAQTNGALGTLPAPTPGKITIVSLPKAIKAILRNLTTKDKFSIFYDPVDPKEVPDYHTVIKNEMNWSEMQKKLEQGLYYSLEGAKKDFDLIVSNAKLYNAPDTIFHKEARRFEELGHRLFDQYSRKVEPQFLKEPLVKPEPKPPVTPTPQQQPKQTTPIPHPQTTPIAKQPPQMQTTPVLRPSMIAQPMNTGKQPISQSPGTLPGTTSTYNYSMYLPSSNVPAQRTQPLQTTTYATNTNSPYPNYSPNYVTQPTSAQVNRQPVQNQNRSTVTQFTKDSYIQSLNEFAKDLDDDSKEFIQSASNLFQHAQDVIAPKKKYKFDIYFQLLESLKQSGVAATSTTMLGVTEEELADLMTLQDIEGFEEVGDLIGQCSKYQDAEMQIPDQPVQDLLDHNFGLLYTLMQAQQQRSPSQPASKFETEIATALIESLTELSARVPHTNEASMR